MSSFLLGGTMALLSTHDQAEVWWEIDCDYEGQLRWGVASGDTLEEAESNFKNSLPHPEHVVIVSVKPVPEITGIEAMADVLT
jgi:hypothetical protein